MKPLLLKTMTGAMSIEYPMDMLEKGRNGAGTHLHRRSDEDGWCGRSGSSPRTSYGKGKPTHIEISQVEVEENIVRARREYEDAKARLSNLEQIMRAMLSEEGEE